MKKKSITEQENFTADRLVVAASGVDHQYLLDVAEPLLSDWHKGSPVERPESKYIGGDFRHRADSEVIYFPSTLLSLFFWGFLLL